MENLLLSIGEWGDWIYLLIFFGMLIEGNATMLIVGFLLSSQTNLSGFGFILAAFLGTSIEQIFWFWFGKKLKNSQSKLVQWVVKSSGHFDRHFIHQPKLTLFVSKFIYGVHRAAIARAGIVGIGCKEYAKQVLPVLILWMLTIGTAGYAIKRSFNLLDQYLQYTEFILLGILVLIILLQRFVLSGKLKELWNRL